MLKTTMLFVATFFLVSACSDSVSPNKPVKNPVSTAKSSKATDSISKNDSNSQGDISKDDVKSSDALADTTEKELTQPVEVFKDAKPVQIVEPKTDVVQTDVPPVVKDAPPVLGDPPPPEVTVPVVTHPLDGRLMAISAVHSGKLLTINGYGVDLDGGNAEQWSPGTYSPGLNTWRFYATGNSNEYYLQLQYYGEMGRFLTVDQGSAFDGANIVQWWGVAGLHQTFIFDDMGGGRYQIRAKHSGKCLDVSLAGGGMNDGDNVQQWTCWGGNNQLWTLTEVWRIM